MKSYAGFFCESVAVAKMNRPKLVWFVTVLPDRPMKTNMPSLAISAFS